MVLPDPSLGNISALGMMCSYSNQGGPPRLMVGTRIQGTTMMLGRLMLLDARTLQIQGSAVVADDEGYPYGWVKDLVAQCYEGGALEEVYTLVQFEADTLSSKPSILVRMVVTET
eukprot:TRINITY_DN21946_c0_g1_i1.p1 TRINITY_DN21946_c0_g1~~TRINITY_DN21946_c0_g1_i1.p1  ORF type:complete len:115 (+),score=23.81 TRINITY_DN21946_c0_g1_i1:3-347(+)